jgi:hypothetical protein
MRSAEDKKSYNHLFSKEKSENFAHAIRTLDLATVENLIEIYDVKEWKSEYNANAITYLLSNVILKILTKIDKNIQNIEEKTTPEWWSFLAYSDSFDAIVFFVNSPKEKINERITTLKNPELIEKINQLAALSKSEYEKAISLVKKMTQCFVDAGVDLNMASPHGPHDTPLTNVIKNSFGNISFELMKFLVDLGADIYSGKNGLTKYSLDRGLANHYEGGNQATRLCQLNTLPIEQGHEDMWDVFLNDKNLKKIIGLGEVVYANLLVGLKETQEAYRHHNTEEKNAYTAKKIAKLEYQVESVIAHRLGHHPNSLFWHCIKKFDQVPTEEKSHEDEVTKSIRARLTELNTLKKRNLI